MGWGQFTLGPHKACFPTLFLITTALAHHPHLATCEVRANHFEIHELQTHLHLIYEKNVTHASSTALISHITGWGQFKFNTSRMPPASCFEVHIKKQSYDLHLATPGMGNHSEIHELQTHLHEKNILYASSTALISHLAGWGKFTLDPHKACFAMLFLITTASIHRPHLATRGVGAIRVKHTQAIF